MSQTNYRFINVVEADDHGRTLTMETVRRCSETFSKPVLFRNMVDIPPKLVSRQFYDEIPAHETLQWRRKQGNDRVSFRTKDGKADYNYVSGHVGTGSEFLDDIFVHNLDVYSHLGTISSGFDDPYKWGKIAFNRVKEEIFRSGWFRIDDWKISGHMFFGYSNEEYGEPTHGAVGSDWHMFPTVNVFVMIAGRKKWMTRPPEIGEQLGDDSNMFPTSSGREAPGADFDHDTVYVEPGDVLVNLPFEWHKVLNTTGLNLGAAFRVIDTAYIARLAKRPSISASVPNLAEELSEEAAHLLTSLSYASHHLNRAQMILNDAEYAYPAMQALGKRLKAAKQAAESKGVEATAAS